MITEPMGTQGNEGGKKPMDKATRALVESRLRLMESPAQRDEAAGLNLNRGLLLRALASQIEFYFGDPNLYRDAALRLKIGEHKKGYVELEHFLKFHRINALMSEGHVTKFEDRLATLRQAIEQSAVLRMCSQKKRVKRRVPYDTELLRDEGYRREMDSRTLYVENLPSSSSQALVGSIFAKFGTVLYVALPKQADGRRPKGYAFVEMRSCEEAERALQLDNCIPQAVLGCAGNEPVEALKVVAKVLWNELKCQFKEVGCGSVGEAECDARQASSRRQEGAVAGNFGATE